MNCNTRQPFRSEENRGDKKALEGKRKEEEDEEKNQKGKININVIKVKGKIWVRIVMFYWIFMR